MDARRGQSEPADSVEVSPWCHFWMLCIEYSVVGGGSLPRGGQSLAWEAQNYRFSSQSETSDQATLLPRCNGGKSRPGKIVTNGYCWGWVVQRYEVCFAGGFRSP
ncbi:uncharacterized protein BO88DRAFT_137329 [Aspergillus vadensis CBS 113365]|uniref:Uncharacterized protein n=1 Tax=Aspergillus vadensis (strain CBS 113365 / IMI 142717 / IBT 24658) TaxID=1448311 RepID=A0A319B673_ASPVC|nr:hypothetical protein BO88DRAFT_137329 [Aspergillus vadensis CBS 113365]PYH65770.1 hypothetical protein BO88DRAFT_137329 [Aspergillus vadensis CBS 113365]